MEYWQSIHRYVLFLVILLQVGCAGISKNANSTTKKPSHKHSAWHHLKKDFQLKENYKHASVQAELQALNKRPKFFEHFSTNSVPYIHYIHKELKKRNMPSELALIPMIESTFDPFAYSSVGAAGLWQLMPGTATGLGLKQTWWYDARRDIRASTKAALDYLAYLQKMFKGDWLHTLAAYNSGQGRVLSAIKKNKKRGLPTDFWSLPLPEQTKNYIPKILAVAHAINTHSFNDNSLPHLPHAPYFTVVQTGKQIDLTQAAKLANVNVAEIYRLNPGFNRWATSPDGPHELLLPIQGATQFVAGWQPELLQSTNPSWQRHKVASGDTLSGIAKRYKTSVYAVKQANQLTSNTIRVNKHLVIPNQYNKTLSPKIRKDLKKFDKKRGPQKVVHRIQKGDSLNKLVRKYGVSLGAIQSWNHLAYNYVPLPGDELTLWINRKKPSKQHYRVRKGDSLTKIAKRFKVEVGDIRRWNKIKNNVVKLGQKIVVYA